MSTNKGLPIPGFRGFAIHTRQSGKVIGYQRAAAEQLEAACARALATGTDGVAVVELGNATAVYILPEVEYMTIAHFPSRETFDAFLAKAANALVTDERTEK